MKPLKIIFFGTTDFGLPGLEKLIQSGHFIEAVVCQPDRPNQRGRKITYLPIKKAGLNHDIDVLQPARIGAPDQIERLKAYQADLFVVAAYGQILPQKILDIPPYGALNIHGSLLPHYRGAAPIQRAIINGEKKTGVTLIQMDAGMDTGPMLAKAELSITNQTTFGKLHQQLAILGGDLLVDRLEDIINKKIIPIKQNEKEATYAHKLTKETGHLTWNEEGMAIVSRINGCDPIPGAYFFHNEEKIKCFTPEFIAQKSDQPPGTIIEANDQEGLVVGAANGLVKIKEIQAPGKKRMATKVYFRGNTLEVGEILK